MNLITLFSIISLFNLIRYSLKIKKVMKMHEDNPNIKGVVIVNGHVKVIEKKPGEQEGEKQSTRAMVQDEVCGKMIKPEDGYCVMINGKKHYFCSWECREAFLRKEKKINEG